MIHEEKLNDFWLSQSAWRYLQTHLEKEIFFSIICRRASFYPSALLNFAMLHFLYRFDVNCLRSTNFLEFSSDKPFMFTGLHFQQYGGCSRDALWVTCDVVVLCYKRNIFGDISFFFK